MVIEFVTSRWYKSHILAQATLLWGTVTQLSDVAHGPLVWCKKKNIKIRFKACGRKGVVEKVLYYIFGFVFNPNKYEMFLIFVFSINPFPFW